MYMYMYIYTLYCITLWYTGLCYVKPYFINYIIVVHYVGMIKNQIVCVYIYIYICEYIYIYMNTYIYIYLNIYI